jgi:hypothetical protein
MYRAARSEHITTKLIAFGDITDKINSAKFFSLFQYGFNISWVEIRAFRWESGIVRHCTALQRMRVMTIVGATLTSCVMTTSPHPLSHQNIPALFLRMKPQPRHQQLSPYIFHLFWLLKCLLET